MEELMRFVRVNGQSATGGMHPAVALDHIKRSILSRRPGGGVHISMPGADESYWIAFQDHAHATAFIDILGSLKVSFVQSQERPHSIQFGLFVPEIWKVAFAVGRSTV
jgi:hypothetical protein